MWFLSEKFNEYSKKINQVYTMSEQLRKIYQHNKEHTGLVMMQSHQLSSLRHRIAVNILMHEKDTQDFSGWVTSCLPWTKAYERRSALATQFSRYEILKNEIEVVNKHLSQGAEFHKPKQIHPKVPNGSPLGCSKPTQKSLSAEYAWVKYRHEQGKKSEEQNNAESLSGASIQSTRRKQ